MDLVQRGVKRLSALGHAALDELLAEGGGIALDGGTDIAERSQRDQGDLARVGFDLL